MQVYMLIMVGEEAGGMIWILAYVGYASVHAHLYLSPKYGLYLIFVPPLIYAFMGSSRDIAIGPVAVVSLLLGTLLRDEVEPNTPEYLRLAFTATFFAGVTQAALGFFQIGFSDRFSVTCCDCGVHGRSGRYHCASAT
ncbi:putative SLC26A/SulP transporter [Helianthus annuus]|nr:putative SLC26A/SulP transporter [Helianthus annuus]